MENGFSTRCQKCGKTLYEGEMLNIKGKYVCEDCADSSLFRSESTRGIEKSKSRDRSPSPFFHFIFACMPGAGNMYLGLMKTGLFQMSLFFLSIYAATFTYVVGLATPIIWFYCLFDSMAKRRKIERGEFVSDDLTHVVNFISNNRGMLLLLVIVMFGLSAVKGLGRVFLEAARHIPYAASILGHSGLLKFVVPAIVITIGIMLVSRAKNKSGARDDKPEIRN